LVPLLVLIGFGFLALRAENLRWTGTPSGGDVARASLLLIFAFLGIEAALVPGGEVRDPARTAPRAIFLAMVAIVAIYLAVQIAAAIAALLAATGSFEPLAILANGSVLLVYAGCCLAALELRRRDVRLEGAPPVFRGRAMSVVPWLALAFIVWLLASLRLR